MRATVAFWSALALATLATPVASDSRAEGPAPERLPLDKGDRIILIGNTLAERMQYFGHWETLLHSRFPELELVVRDLGWSADELTLRPRSKDFDDHGHTLEDEKPDVVIAAFGFNESFAGPEGLETFRRDLAAFIDETTTTPYNGEEPPTLVLLSPIAHEDLGRRTLPDGSKNNANLALYTDAMAEIARSKGVLFVDLFHPTKQGYAEDPEPWTFNGVHLTDAGYRKLAPILDEALFGPRPGPGSIAADLDALRAAVLEKNKQFFYDYRAINGYYIYGGRKEPFGVVNFPAEFAKLRKMIEVRDRRIWEIARGNKVPDQIDDSGTGAFVPIESNVKGPITITSPEETLATFELPEGYEINLFASEREFPDLKNPCQMAFDPKGRLWVTTMASYPMYLPGTPVDDKILILEDTDGDGTADKQITFARGLHVPTGLEIGDGGAYIAQQPNLLFARDTDGDDVADEYSYRLHGFDSADSHHSLSAFTWGPGGALYFQEGTFHHTQIETPYGPTRVKDAAVFRYEPLTEKVDIFVSYPFANPWGHTFDRWGQNFVADASGGANYYGTAFSGDVDYPRKHPPMQQFLVKQWRPTSGCELVSSRNFPEEAQGNYLLNNVIGFHGVLQYTMREEGSGFAADPVEPLLRSSDTNFRPVDLEFGPDGALYLVDWFNPLIGHMQHSIRDPNRDVNHGRIWRIRYTGKPLVDPAKIAGASIPELLDLLKTYEDRTRYRTRIELRSRDADQVMAALDPWIAELNRDDPDYWRQMLEALWVHQQFDVVDQDLLETVLRCPEPKARAAATRVLGYWRDRVDDPLGLLQTQVNDDHPRVRLEAVRALSFFKGEDAARAQEIALESLLHPQDYYLEYTLNETNATLSDRILKLGLE
ncbi:azurin [Tautonia sociabilis]|uniref:Azurin n=2 Tax=Tautonia sociabilis TaxID=2080755 RepID=A0A432MH97_9BACT|nr:azurin [Tautonia sociabilis]